MAEKSASNVLAAIEGSKSRGLARLLSGLGIRFVGSQNAAILAGDFGTIDALAAATEEELLRSEGIGPEIARSVALFFAQEPNRAMVARLKAAGVDVTAPLRAREPVGVLAGKTLVLTGTLPNLTRDEAAELIVAAGGKVSIGRLEEDRLRRRGRRSRHQARQSRVARHPGPRRSRPARRCSTSAASVYGRCQRPDGAVAQSRRTLASTRTSKPGSAACSNVRRARTMRVAAAS